MKRSATRARDVRRGAQQPPELEQQVALVEAAALEQDRVVAVEELGELELAPARLALGAAAAAASTLAPRDQRPGAARRGSRPRALSSVDPLEQAGEQARRVAADLVAAQRQLVEAVEQDREPVGGADGLEEGVEARLERVVAQQPLGESS